MIEEIQAIGAVIAGLGDAGKSAFIWWLAIDLAKTVVVYGAGLGAVVYVANRIGRGITAVKQA